MSVAALGEPVQPSRLGYSSTTEPPIPRSVDSDKEQERLEMMKTLPNDPSLEATTTNRSSPGNGVSELLQRALSLKDGGGDQLDEEAKEGERTPGSHSRASTDLTAVEQSRISPAESISRTESSSRPSGSRNNSLNTDPSPPASRFRNSASSSSRRPPSRPQGPSHHPSQQRITPPNSWNASSPSSSSDGANHPLAFNPPPQYYYPSQPYGTAHPQQGGGAGAGGGGYAYSTTSPPFLSQSGRHPSHISQISQVSDQSAGYSTGSPYSSSSSLWYQQYASTVTTPSGYPTPVEGGILYQNDTSPEASSEALSSSQCGPGYQFEGSMQPGHGQGQQQQHFVEPSNPSSPPNPYQPVYFAPPPQRVPYTSPPPSRVSPTGYGTAAATASSPSAGQMAYPISSARPHPVDQGAPPPPPPPHSSYPVRGNEQHWPAPHHQQTLVPSHQPPYQAYGMYSPPPQPGVPIDQRRYHYQAPNPHGLPPNPGFAHYPSHAQNPSSRPFPRPPVIPPRPVAGSQQFSPRSTPNQYPQSSPPKIYAPPVEIARGVLASTRLREAAQPSNTAKPVRATRNESAGQFIPRKGNLPKPPAHSPHALWVGNVPSDASHSELWQFFVSRPSPSAMGLLSKEDIDLTTPGVESIHLIARSNCAFVNYISDLHLQHAISVSNGLSLRPNDPRCKTLLCRVRKQEDESKTGVGAQRIGGIHKAFVKLQSERMGESEHALRLKIEEEGAEPKSAATKAFEERRQSSSSVSIGTTSTTSSFLTKHFEKRWFIMKSHDEADLKLSVESGLWATQPHNEPVLQQAFRTAKEVFLVFSANGSGEWFGYARMTGPITSVSSSKSSRPSWSSSGQASVEESISSSSLSAPSQTIQEDSDEPSSFPPRAPVVIFSPSEHRLAQASPSMITPSPAPQSQLSDQRQGGSYPLKLPSEIEAEAKREMAIEQERMAFVTATNLHLPAEVAEAARKAATYDSAALVAAKKGRVPNDEVYPGGLRDAIRRVDMATGEEEITKTGDDDPRKPARSGSSSTWGTPFSVEWVKVSRLPFSRTRHIRNSFNGNREIKVSRDGTEVEPAAGQALIDEFARLPDSPGLDHSSSLSPAPPSRP